MNKYPYLLLFALLLFSLNALCQDDYDTLPCDYTHYTTVEKIEKDIQFIIEYNSYIDFNNENCSYSVAENYYNLGPDMLTKTLCVIYINNEQVDNEMNYLDLFYNHEVLKKYRKNIQLVFITDRRTELWKSYETKEEIENIFKLDIRKGIKPD